MIPKLRSGCDEFFLSEDGYGIFDGSVYDKVYDTCIMNDTTATSNALLSNYHTTWPATIEKIRGLSNSRLGDFATKGTARALPCSTRLRYYYGDDVIRDTTCPLCGDPNDTQKHIFCEC
jgi:hypothetical protein